ncbi:MAG: hypothetical protein RSC04_04655, partial [Bacteroidales bacterium]
LVCLFIIVGSGSVQAKVSPKVKDSTKIKRTLSNILNPQANPHKPTLKISGFVNAQLFYDTRQVVEGREALLELYPKQTDYDPNGEDLNAHPNLNEVGMMSRVTLSLSGPEIWKARTLAVLEGDFTGQTNSDNNGFRLRHAYIKMNWEHWGFLMGQTWQAFTIIETVPEVVGLNAGSPFRPHARHPQIRVESYFKNFTALAAASFQRDNVSMGPNGSSNIYARNAVFPTFDLQLRWQNEHWMFAIDGNVKRIQPTLKTNTGYVSHEVLTSFAATAALRYTSKNIKLKAQGVWGQNLTEYSMLGGYIETGLTDFPRADITLANTSQASAWFDLSSAFPAWNVGLFLGYAQNLAYQKPIACLDLPADNILDKTQFIGKFYGRNNNIASLYRISPRVTYKYKTLLTALETEFMSCYYGEPDREGWVQNAKPVYNLRLLLSVTYFF